MKAAPIAQYLDHIGRTLERPAPRREASLFRPRALQGSHSKDSSPPTVLSPATKPAPAFRPPDDGAFAHGPERHGAPIESSAYEAFAGRDATKPADIALRLAEAHTRGREEGLAEARAESEERRTQERVAEQERVLADRTEFRLGEYARLEASIRTALAEVEDRIGAVVARILTPFLTDQAVKIIVDELGKAVGRLCAGTTAPGPITIRGPERALSLLRNRVADLPPLFDFIDSGDFEVVVQANSTRIESELGRWAELLSSFDG